MRQLGICVIIISLILANAIDDDIDQSLCPNGATKGLDPQWRKIPSRFEIMTELVSKIEVAGLSQAFSTQRDAVVMDTQFG